MTMPQADFSLPADWSHVASTCCFSRAAVSSEEACVWRDRPEVVQDSAPVREPTVYRGEGEVRIVRVEKREKRRTS